MTSSRKEKINYIKLGMAAVIMITVGIFSSQFNNEKKTFSARAEYDGTFCNDNAGDTLNSNGSTSFLINCWGKLDRKFTYVLFWCPDKSKGATSCGDPTDLNSGQAQVLDRADGASLTSYMSKSTDKTCGCVQWDVGVGGSTGQEGVAGGAIMCANTACNANPTTVPTSAPNPTAAQPTIASNTPNPTAKPVGSCYPGQTKCPGTNLCVDFQDQCTSTPTPTKTKTPNGTQCSDGSTCQSGCCSDKLCNSASMCQNKPSPTPSSSAECPPFWVQCRGTNRCVQFLSECTQSPATPVPTPTPQIITAPTTFFGVACDLIDKNLWKDGCINISNWFSR